MSVLHFVFGPVLTNSLPQTSMYTLHEHENKKSLRISGHHGKNNRIRIEMKSNQMNCIALHCIALH